MISNVPFPGRISNLDGTFPEMKMGNFVNGTSLAVSRNDFNMPVYIIMWRDAYVNEMYVDKMTITNKD